MKTSKYSAAGMDFIRYSNVSSSFVMLVNCPNLKELGNKIYFEFDINTTWNATVQDLEIGDTNRRAFIMPQKSETQSYSNIAVWVSGSSKWDQESVIAKIGSGVYGISYNPSSNSIVFYYNSSALVTIDASKFLPLYIYSKFNKGIYQHIFRNEFANIPDGYTVLGDYMGKEAYKDNEYYYTYK